MNEEYKHEHETFGFEIPGLPEETIRLMQGGVEKAEKEITEAGKVGFGLASIKAEGEPVSWDPPAEGIEPCTWVERLVPEHLEDSVHDLITTLLKSHGYNWEGEKQ